MYVDELRQRCPSIEQVWLAGASNDGEPRGYELLAFADGETLEQIRTAPDHALDDVDLIVVVDGDRFERAFGDRASGRLSNIGWTLDNAEAARYRAADGAAELTAVRVR
jgi:hypothetical protein